MMTTINIGTMIRTMSKVNKIDDDNNDGNDENYHDKNACCHWY